MRTSCTLKIVVQGVVWRSRIYVILIYVTLWDGINFCKIYYVSFLFNVVGVQKARRIAGSFNLPIVGVHHMEAHALVSRYGNESGGNVNLSALQY